MKARTAEEWSKEAQRRYKLIKVLKSLAIMMYGGENASR